MYTVYVYIAAAGTRGNGDFRWATVASFDPVNIMCNNATVIGCVATPN